MKEAAPDSEKKLKGLIPEAEARKLIANYKENKKKHLDKERKKDPDVAEDYGETTSVWFDHEFCKELIADLQQPHIKGLRIYFGAYDKKHQKPDKKNKMTVVLVTTSGSETKPEAAFDEWTSNKELNASYNEGSLCPPRCNPPLPH